LQFPRALRKQFVTDAHKNTAALEVTASTGVAIRSRSCASPVWPFLRWTVIMSTGNGMT